MPVPKWPGEPACPLYREARKRNPRAPTFRLRQAGRQAWGCLPQRAARRGDGNCESPRACQPRDGPETSDAESATGPADSLGSATVLALPARALSRPARPTAVALHASLNDRHRGADIPGTDLARYPLASPRAGSRLPFLGVGASPSSSAQGDACAKTQPFARRRLGNCNTRRYGDWYFDKSRKRLAKAPEIPDALVGYLFPVPSRAATEFFPEWCAKTRARISGQYGAQKFHPGREGAGRLDWRCA